MDTPSTPFSILRWNGHAAAPADDELASEEPLEIRVRGRAVSVTLRTPGHDAELAAGFLLTEGLVHRRADILKIEPCERNDFGNLINVQLAPEVPVDFERLTRHVFAASSCGLCGKASIDAIRCHFPSLLADGMKLSAQTLAAFPAAMRAAQPTFDRTGGLHAAALFDDAGKLLLLREDIGRHNAVDKLLGHALLHDWLPLDRHVLLVSGRASFEIMQKSLAGRIPVVAAVSAPSDLAAQFARDSGQTLVGFLRENRMNVYSHPQRLIFD